MNYPPIGKMLELYLSSEAEELLLKIVNYVKLQVERANIEGVQMIGPAKAVIYKLQDNYRQVFYFKCEDEELLIRVRDYLDNVTSHFMNKYNCKVGVQFDLP